MSISRIVLGLILIVGAGGAIATGTSAFFNDTEESTGNTFTAGEIDLKVDHTKQTYNDEECTDDCVEQTTNLVVDGGFEFPEVTNDAQWQIFNSPAGAWIVEWREAFAGAPTPPKLELHEGVLGSAFEGDQYAELDTDWDGPGGGINNEQASVRIYQDIVTAPGRKYKLRYVFAPRPSQPTAENRLEVRWGGSLVEDTGPVVGPAEPIQWQQKEFEVTATTTLTRLQFTDLGTANSLGTFLDNVRLNEIICTPSIGSGGQCKLWTEKDLADGDAFWNFNDVKPGDHGTNVMSLHVFGNDAYACLLTEDVKDDENIQIQPEKDAGDNDGNDGPGFGELSQFMELFIWGDDNDGVYEPGLGETQLYQGPFTNVGMQKLPLAATTTAYLGVAWCFGDQTINGGTGAITCDGSGDTNQIAQTDILTADLVFDAVQQRHNENFQCPNFVAGP